MLPLAYYSYNQLLNQTASVPLASAGPGVLHTPKKPVTVGNFSEVNMSLLIEQTGYDKK